MAGARRDINTYEKKRQVPTLSSPCIACLGIRMMRIPFGRLAILATVVQVQGERLCKIVATTETETYKRTPSLHANH